MNEETHVSKRIVCAMLDEMAQQRNIREVRRLYRDYAAALDDSGALLALGMRFGVESTAKEESEE